MFPAPSCTDLWLHSRC